MSAKTKTQQKSAGNASAAKRDDKSEKELSGTTGKMGASANGKKTDDKASAKHKGKPEHAGKSS